MTSTSVRTTTRTSTAGGPSIAPCLLLRRGEVCLPGADGPVPARRQSGGAFDVFDIIDRLSPVYPFLYLADLDGLEENDPQLEYIQELSRDMPLWVDSGVRKGDQAIDILVAGAQKAVLSSAYLRGPKELRRAWKMSTEFVFEVETTGGHLGTVDASWESTDPLEIIRVAREVGIGSIIVSPRETDPDWSLIATLASGGPTWVDGSFTPTDAPRLVSSGATGGIFHIDRILADMDPA